MANLKAIRKRIGSVKNTQKITRAMKLVAAARLRKAADAITAARPYAESLETVIAELASRASGEDHPLLEEREPVNAEIVLLTSDRGLAGGFNANLNRRGEKFLADNESGAGTTTLALLGRKGVQYFRRRNAPVTRTFEGVASENALERARELAATYVQLFKDGEIDAVYYTFNQFKSAMTQTVVTKRLLPVEAKDLPKDGSATEFLYEPSKQELLDTILPLYVEIQLYRAMLESIASELGARMSAMDSATKNATELIDKLTLQYNRARQAAITKEILEIIGGAEALSG